MRRVKHTSPKVVLDEAHPNKFRRVWMHLFYNAYQITGFCMKRNTGLKWVKNNIVIMQKPVNRVLQAFNSCFIKKKAVIRLRLFPPHRNQSFDWYVNQWDGFFMITSLALNGFKQQVTF